jgi:hypothetical protein
VDVVVRLAVRAGGGGGVNVSVGEGVVRVGARGVLEGRSGASVTIPHAEEIIKHRIDNMILILVEAIPISKITGNDVSTKSRTP